MNLHYYIYKYINKLNLPTFIENFIIGAIELIGLTLFTFFIDFILKKITHFVVGGIVKRFSQDWLLSIYKNKIFNSICHFISVSIAYFVMTDIIEIKNSIAYNIATSIMNIAVMILIIQMLNRIIDAILEISSSRQDHRTVAVRSMGQFTKIILYIFGFIYMVAVLANQDFKVVFGSLSALTAIIILVFKDVILGFVSGMQLASTKAVKVGDWIALPKHEVDGEVTEINLVTAKIRNWDKTISTIPTYDLISTAVKSYEPMREANVRRIKRSLFFNIKSFHFLEQSDIDALENFQLLKEYLETKRKEMVIDPRTGKFAYNGKRITNIGTFRKYAELYLTSHSDIAEAETIMVRQLDPTPHGLPLEIYCFIKDSEWKHFEGVQADIFDHLLTITQEFGLEVMQLANK